MLYPCDTSNHTIFGMLSSFLMFKTNLGHIPMRKLQNAAIVYPKILYLA